MGFIETPLRLMQREHALVLLKPSEFAELLSRREIDLPERHWDHFGKVLRRGRDWQAIAGDGKGRVIEALVAGRKIRIEHNAPGTIRHRARQVTLLQAWPKPKALSLILQKSAELGVDEVILADSEHAQPHSDKAERLELILENGCLQAYNPYVPVLHFRQLTDASSFVTKNAFFGDILGTTPGFPAEPGDQVLFANGPEGGFSPAEIEWLKGHATGLLLSENVLRSETAAIIALGFFCQKL